MKVPVSALLQSPVNFLALGAGSGLAPVAPGTFGTVAAIPLLFLMPNDPIKFAVVIVALFILGVWLCDQCAKSLGVHDHPAIVWDEWVGFFITMIAVERSFLFVLLGFALFRFFDVLKPWPIRLADKNMHGGLGIMVDDVLAGVFAGVSLQVIIWLISIWA